MLSLFLADLTQMVDTIKCQTEADLTEPFFKKLLLGAIDKTLDHEESIPAPISYNNYTYHSGQPTRRATSIGNRQQQSDKNLTGKSWDIDQKPAESSNHSSNISPPAATLNDPYNNTSSSSYQPPPRLYAEQNFGQTSEQQQPYQERLPSLAEQPLPYRLIHPSTMPADSSEEQYTIANNPGGSPRHRLSLSFGLNKKWRGS